MTTASRDSEAYRLHLYVYGKLIQSSKDHRGKIMPGADHRMTGRSLGFPDDLQAFCAPDQFVAQWQGANSVDGRLMPGGAMLYRPVLVAGRLYGLFARIQSRSEAGEGMPGRAYTHCAVLAVEDRWEPALIPAMADLLFGETDLCYGVPNFEGQRDRLELALGELQRDAVLASAQSPERAAAHPAILRAQRLASRLAEADLNVHGRWLPFALGVKQGVEARCGRFHAINHGGEDVGLTPPSFSDSGPPEAVAQPELEGEIDASRFTLAAWGPVRGVIRVRRPLLTARHLWPEQMAALPEQPAELVEDDSLADRVRRTVDGALQERAPYLASFAQEALAEQELGPWPGHAAPGTRRGDPLAQYLSGLRFANPDHRAYVESVDLGYVRAARDYFHGRLSGLSEPHFAVYRWTDEDRKVINALEAVLGLSMRVAVQGDMTEYGRLLATDLLYMPALPRLGLPTEGPGSAFAYMVYALQHYANTPEPKTQDSMPAIDHWFLKWGFPPSGITSDNERRARSAAKAFSNFGHNYLQTQRHDCYTKTLLGIACFEEWWGHLQSHAKAQASWLPVTRWAA